MDDRPRPTAPMPAVTAATPSTTFVHTDQSTFKELVQRLTGPTAAAAADHHATSRPPPAPTGVRRPAFKPAHHHHHRPKLTIVKPASSLTGFLSPAVLSPSSSDMAGLHIRDKDVPSPSSAAAVMDGVVIDEAEEEKAIKERRFYLHPSPRSASSRRTGRSGSAVEPELLPLFPLTSPKYSREA